MQMMLILHIVFFGFLQIAQAFTVLATDLHCKEDQDCVLVTEDCVGFQQTVVAKKAAGHYRQLTRKKCQSYSGPHPSIFPPSPTVTCEQKKCRADFVLSDSNGFKEFDGRQVVLRGVYKTLSRPIKGMPRQSPGDYAVIELSDQTPVFLEALDSPLARREKKERLLWEGKEVRVRGRLQRFMPNQSEGLLAPCLSEIDGIIATK